MRRVTLILNCLLLTVFLVPYTFRGAVEITVPKFGIFESNFTHEGNYKNPYLETEAYAELTRPDKAIWSIPLFWDGGNIWKLRISPDKEGTWTFRITSKDKGLNGKKGKFTCVASDLKGSYIPMKNHPHHFQYQNGEPVWFMGETAWALFTDNKSEKHERPEVEEFIRTRSSQGFNTVHAMLFSEAGWGNSGGMPFKNLALQEVNPAYWQEVDERIEYTNNKGIIVGLVLAWGDKNRKVPFPWRLFPDLEARKRYARYIAARYSAYNVYFILSGEWHAEAKTRPAPEAEIKKEFIEIGAELKRWEPHSRMIGIHPMTSHGSVREFNEADWMSFGDYQQNYHSLHERMLESMKFNKPVVNAEYAYYLRDQNGDGKPDKENSVNIECIRHASWDIVMSGGYLVTGFGTTYFGGYRDPGPFDVNTPKNDDWEKQAGIMKEFFTKLNWWKLNSFDQWLVCNQVPGSDTRVDGVIAPPVTACWLLADPGNTYVIYARGVDEEIILQQNSIPEGKFKTVLFNPATGNTTYKGEIIFAENVFKFKTPDKGDWVILLTKK